MSPVRFLVAPLEPKFKINKTLQINDLWRFSFVKNRYFWCKMTQFSVLFMDIFWIPQKCTLIASYFTIFNILQRFQPSITRHFCRVFLLIRVHTNNVSKNSTLIVLYFVIYQHITTLCITQYPTLFCRVFSSIRVRTNNMSIKMYTIFFFSRNPYSPISTILSTSPDIEA